MDIVMDNTDYFCVKCLANGDEDSFMALYNKYHSKIYTMALTLTQSEVVAEDVTQDVFLKVWETRTRLDPKQNFESYISVICRNEVFDLFKKATHEESVKNELMQFSEIAESDEEDDVYETYRQLLDDAIAALPNQRRMIFELCKLKGLSYNKVALKLNISRSTVQDHIVKANKFVREYLLSHVK